LEGAYDLAHLQEFHRFIFQDIYSWAGELRSVPLAKPGSMFALPEHIERYATEVLRQLSD
jgi:cell filamentation protein